MLVCIFVVVLLLTVFLVHATDEYDTRGLYGPMDPPKSIAPEKMFYVDSVPEIKMPSVSSVAVVASVEASSPVLDEGVVVKVKSACVEQQEEHATMSADGNNFESMHSFLTMSERVAHMNMTRTKNPEAGGLNDAMSARVSAIATASAKSDPYTRFYKKMNDLGQIEDD